MTKINTKINIAIFFIFQCSKSIGSFLEVFIWSMREKSNIKEKKVKGFAFQLQKKKLILMLMNFSSSGDFNGSNFFLESLDS